MRIPVLIGILSLLLATSAPAAIQPAGADDPVAVELHRVAKMSPSEQQAWLQQLEDRAIQAGQSMLEPEKAAEHSKEIRAKLHQKMVSWQILREVLEDTDAREKAIAERLAAESPQPIAPLEAPPVPKTELPPETEQPPIETPQVIQPDTADLPMQTRVEPPSQEPLPEPPPSIPTEPGAPDDVEIKTDELASRIAGCNLAIRALEIDLDEEKTWTAERLASLLDRLTILAIRRNDLNLFREALPQEQQASVDELASIQSIVSLFGSRIYEVRAHVSSEDFEGTETERQAELQKLDALSRQLAAVVKE